MPMVMSDKRPAAFRRGPMTKPRSSAPAASGLRPAAVNSAWMPGPRAAFAHALQALFDQQSIVGVELDHIGHRAECDQIQQVAQVRLGLFAEDARAEHLGAQRQQHVEHHADAGQMFAGKFAAGLVGIDDQRIRQGVAGQMVIGDQHIDAQLARGFDAGMRGDAVIDGNQQIRLALAASATISGDRP
jgi:hypothetical protein